MSYVNRTNNNAGSAKQKDATFNQKVQGRSFKKEVLAHPATPAEPDINTRAGTNISAPLPLYVNTIGQTAAVLQISTKSVRRLIDRNLLAASKGLRHIRVSRQAIEDYLARTSK